MESRQLVCCPACMLYCIKEKDMPIKIITGPERSGKQRILFAKAAETIRSKSSDRLLILVPTIETLKALPSMILHKAPIEGFFLPNQFTFESLADRIIQDSGEGLKKLDSVGCQYVLSEIIEDFRKYDKNGVFYGSSRRIGFLNYIYRFISSMKQAEISAEAILEKSAGDSSPLSAAAEIYKKYQDYLRVKKLYDDNGLFWKAREILSVSKPDFIAGAEVMLVYGFTSFTYVQRDILKILSETIPDVMLSLCVDEEPARPDLFNETLFVLADLKKMNPTVEAALPPSEGWRFRLLERNLFKNSSVLEYEAASAGECADRIKLCSAPDIRTEAEAVAAGIKTFIVRDDLSPDEIAVICPDINAYSKHLKRELSQAGIPYSLSNQTALNETPLGQFFHLLIKAVISDLPRSDFKIIAASKFFYRLLKRRIASVKENENNDLSFAECSQISSGLIERSSISKGIGDWKNYFNALLSMELMPLEKILAKQLIRYLDELTSLRSMKDYGEAGSFLSGILDEVENGNENAEYTCSAQIKTERAAAEEIKRIFSLNLPVISSDDSGANCRALKRVLFAMERTEILLRQPEEGRVLVSNPYAFRGRKTKALFFIGMNNGSFPKYQNINKIPFINAVSGLDDDFVQRLPRKLDMAEDQMILFYSLLCSADEYITLSWVKNDENDKSVFIDDVIRSVPGLKIESKAQFEIKPEYERLTGRERLLQAVRMKISAGDTSIEIEDKTSVDGDNKSRLSEKVFVPADEIFPSLERYSALSEIENKRESGRQPDLYDGVLSGKAAHELLSKKYSPSFQFTASMFNDFGKCPFMFFSRHLLKMKILEEKQDELNTLDEGSLYHSVLREFYSALNTKMQKNNLGTADYYLESIDLANEIVDRQLNERIVSDRSVSTDFLTVKKNEIKKILLRFIKYDLMAAENDLVPTWFETGFGSSAGGDETSAVSVKEPLAVEYEGSAVNLTGKIDRIDIFAGDNFRINIVDYKTKNFSDKEDIINGTEFQLPIYILGAYKIAIGKNIFPSAVDGQFVSIKKLERGKKFSGTEKSILYPYDKNEPLDALLFMKKYIFRYREKIASGFFPPFVKKDCGYCGLRRLCRFNPVRNELKRTEAAGE